jgi:hypothetical protein
MLRFAILGVWEWILGLLQLDHKPLTNLLEVARGVQAANLTDIGGCNVRTPDTRCVYAMEVVSFMIAT